METLNENTGSQLKFAVTGPESSGKTALAQGLAGRFSGSFVPEFARSYLSALTRPYEEPDLLVMARGQVGLEEKAGAKSLLFIDTEMTVFKVWSDAKYGRCHPWILYRLENQEYDHIFLCKPDIPWEEDPLRESEHDRDRLFDRYMAEISKRKIPFTIISGNNRLDQAAVVVERLIF